MKWSSLAYLILVLLAGCGKKDEERILGTWKVESIQSKSEKQTDISIPIAFIFTSDQMTWNDGISAKKGTYKIDPSKDPKTIDFRLKDSTGDTIGSGIYKIEGDTLTLYLDSKERPKAFTTPKGDFGLIWVAKRSK
jgi:uncharacterized protein (TIGR03067 family)